MCGDLWYDEGSCVGSAACVVLCRSASVPTFPRPTRAGLDVDLDYVETIIKHGGGTYFWTVMVVQEEPYSRVGAWGENGSFIYVEPEPPAERSTQGP